MPQSHFEINLHLNSDLVELSSSGCECWGQQGMVRDKSGDEDAVSKTRPFVLLMSSYSPHD